MEQLDIDTATAAAENFFKDMAEWEAWCAGMQGGPTTADLRRAKLQEIFLKHLSAKALKRKQGRLHSLMIGMPPEYARSIVNSEEAGKDMVWVYLPARWKDTDRILIKKENGSWKIETKEEPGSTEGEWLKRPHL